jgi:hypothetical protein
MLSEHSLLLVCIIFKLPPDAYVASPKMHKVAAKPFQKCANKSVTTWSQDGVSDL